MKGLGAMKITAEGNSAGHPAGTVCYEFHGHDYGCAREDTAYTGVPHIALTLNPDNAGPFFTCPVETLAPRPMGHYATIGRE
jgi:hypothetical protein